MAEEVKLPQLGESVTEGVITAWLVDEGEEVEEDQPLFEISTDKIDTEVPSPASGVLQEIRAQVDDTVEVGEVVAVIGEGDGAGAEDQDDDESDDTDAEAGDGEADDDQADDEAETEEVADREEREEAAAEEVDEAAETGEDAPSGEDQTDDETEDETEDGRDRGGETDGESRLLSPIVRRLVREHDLDTSRIEGSGEGGRITREDVEEAIESGGAAREEEPARREASRGPERGAPTGRKPHESVRGRSEKLERVRAAIAKHMWDSLHTTAQLTAAREADVTGIMDVRARAKDEFSEREGVPLSPLPFFARAVCMVLPQHEALNASIDVDAGRVKFYETINLGIAVDAPQGLIVPNIKDAQDLTVPALAKRIADVADRVRNRKISPDDVQGGTFTITNTGSRGVLFDTPVLNPPETGILATPAIEKRPVVVERDGSDAIAIRYMTYLCLTYDHRMVDGADAARFLGDLQEVIETHDWATELGV